MIGSYGYIYNAKGQRIYQIEGDGNLTAYTYDPAGRIKEVYYPFADKKKVEDYKERFYYGLLPEYDQPCRFRLNIPNLYWDELASLNDQIRDLFDSFNKDFDDDKNNNGKHRGQKEKEVEVSCGHNNLPFVSKLNLDYQNRNRIEEMYRKVREGRGYLDLHKGFWKEEYTYDPNGNITQKRNGWGSIDYQYNQANQLQQAGNRVYRYDPNGNTVQEVLGKYKVDYTYDYENRLIKASSQFKHHFSHWPVEGEVSFGYDALGRMVKKELNSIHGPKNETETEYYIYNGLGLDILADYKYQTRQYGRYGVKGELDGVNEYYYGNGLLLASKRFDGQGRGHWGWDRDPLKDISFYQHDVLGSVVMLTDRNGHVDERYEYDIWGKAYDGKFADGSPGCGNGQNGNVYGFTGQRYQAEIGVYSFAFRDYNPRLMRWITEDPIKDRLNWYQYCYSNPVNYIDPLGLCNEEDNNQPTEDRYEIYYSHNDDTIYWVNVGNGNQVVNSWEARDAFVAGNNEQGQPRASLPNGDYTATALTPGENYGRAYGTFYIDTGDPRGRDIHGGGSRFTPANEERQDYNNREGAFAPEQGWAPTYGCLRMQNEAGEELSQNIIDAGNSIPLHVSTDVTVENGVVTGTTP